MSVPGNIGRRAFLAGGASGAALVAGTARAQDTPAANADGAFTYEIRRSPEEWRAQLSEDEYSILRDGRTEPNWTSSYAKENNPGTYHCVGCDLPVYRSEHWQELPIGFVFFTHAIPNAVLTGIDTTDYNGALPEPLELIEVHCRRCGSHFGHVIVFDGATPLHCINGTALSLQSA
ncbi:peptide-methionine (R)-S-oxide reductase [Palleronia salina]|uniref:peptide-methionine (R)-S-oxide reductase n=1 Tax=Palleronia salina TaxID=313368 RepID=A0A1M6GD47_9RHOB|nr:peptide-methionine (R)-S-oxide reductase [Palleronia salina]SHJ07826.1 peptide-methionine (R)-S-oxide reductase [Palleronia salina]